MTIKAITNVSTFLKENKTAIIRTTLIVTGVVSGIIAGSYIITKMDENGSSVSEIGETIINLTPDITTS